MNNKELIASELAKVIDSLDQDAILNLLEQPKTSDLGDIAFPAFSLAKVERKAPQAIAADIAEKIDQSAFEKVVATGPYVNFFLDKSKISDQVIKSVIEAGADYGQQDEGHGQNITIDLSSPNIAKPFSVGHLRSTVIGDALSNIFRKMGYNTIKINHLGDWGKQFGLLMVAYKKWGSKEAVEANPIDELLKLYVRINAEIENDPELDEEGRLWFKKLEDGDPEATELWQWFRDESLVEFNRIYKLLGVEFDSLNGEAFYNDKMDEGVQILEDKGLLKESKGASIVELDDFPAFRIAQAVCRICRWCEVGFAKDRLDTSVSVLNVRSSFSFEGYHGFEVEVIPVATVCLQVVEFNRTNTDCMCHFFLVFQFRVLFFDLRFGTRDGFLKSWFEKDDISFTS